MVTGKVCENGTFIHRRANSVLLQRKGGYLHYAVFAALVCHHSEYFVKLIYLGSGGGGIVPFNRLITDKRTCGADKTCLFACV